MKRFGNPIDCFIKDPIISNVVVSDSFENSNCFIKDAGTILQKWWDDNRGKIMLHGLFFRQVKDEHNKENVRKYFVSEKEKLFDDYFAQVAEEDKECEFIKISELEIMEKANTNLSDYAMLFCSYNGSPLIIKPLIKTLALERCCKYFILEVSFLNDEECVYDLMNSLGLKRLCCSVGEFVH